MPEPRSARVNVRVTPAGKQAITALAQKSGHDESEVIRMLLQYGLQHMPEPTKRGTTL